MPAPSIPTLYWISGSPPSWRVMLGLRLKRIVFASRRLDHDAGENRSDEYLAINPRGQVPTLVHGSVTVRESIAILAYLDRAWPELPIFGTSATEAAAIWQTVMVFEADLRPVAAVIAPVLLRNRSAARADALSEAVASYLTALDAIETELAENDYLGPGAPSAADCWLYPTLGWIDRALAMTADRTDAALRGHVIDRPALARWRARFGVLPGVADTFPPHWAEAPAL